ncbi:homocysteine S-methyltransferase family protein [Leucobacter sp. CSA2]|uniref:Homocysteine S-methyltransferase family protein n=1 Tax=Leucobacter edaphi TaxID=2796472 RepID=A0A934QDH3_9MICO|nr:homocysteine S-methyltransferase family protein [Leucobacter edaphi]MBK0422636.1 homocysteine S-methyltransferase family protein [Leucobacter edaphi]
MQVTGTVLTDGGIETALEDRLGQELREFAAFELLGTAAGREALREYYRPFVELARDREIPIVLDTPTWRANPAWGDALGYDADALAEVNTDAVALVRVAAESLWEDGEVTVNGCVGPRFDEYERSQRMTAAEAADYHGPQVAALAEAGADRVTSVTTLDAAEGIGVVRAARAAGIEAFVSFTVGPDGLLADGTTIVDGIRAVEAETDGYASGYLLNCAHPSEAAQALAEHAGMPELARIVGFRLNAALADDEGAGDPPAEFAAGLLALRSTAPSAIAFGGCCGTDIAHIAAVADRAIPAEPAA